VPAIGCDSPVCRSTTRGIAGRGAILIDLDGEAPRHTSRRSPPASLRARRHVHDLRAQALANGVRRVDAIMFTHSHADHVLGLDDVRRFKPIQQSASDATRTGRRWPTCGGCFRTSSTADLTGRRNASRRRRVAQLSLFRWADFSLGRRVVPIPVMHGPRPILGYGSAPLRT